MLKGISPLISPDLLKVLAEMGHGDEIVFADAHFPGHSLNSKLIRADGLNIDVLLAAIQPLFELDTYEASFIMMETVPGDVVNPEVELCYRDAMFGSAEGVKTTQLERYAFYERSRQAFAIVMTGELATYGNVILKKGLQPVRA